MRARKDTSTAEKNVKMVIFMVGAYFVISVISSIIGCGPSVTRSITVDGHSVVVDKASEKVFDEMSDAISEIAVNASRDAIKNDVKASVSAKNDVRKAIIALETAYREDERLTTEAIRKNDLEALKKVGEILDKYHDRMHEIVNGNPSGDTALAAAEWYRDQLVGKKVEDLVSSTPGSKSIASNDDSNDNDGSCNED